ncbi:MAG: class I SAM-dependent methyltransferase [Methanosarcinaceae archaeon]
MKSIKYLCYVLIALSCPLVMAIYHANGMVCTHVVRYEAIAAILATCFAILAYSEYRGTRKPVGHWLSVLIPLTTIPLVPLVMMIRTGSCALLGDGWMALATVEGFALAQFIVAILMFRGLIFKRGTDELMMPGIGFVIMRMVLRVREIRGKPERTLRQMKLAKGQTILDYGCGIGSFSTLIAEMIGDAGVVYALDIHPLAIQAVEKSIRKKGITNIKTILSSLETGLPMESVDAVLLHDVLQMVTDQEGLLLELHRVLKSGGSIYTTSEHLEQGEFMDIMGKGGLFLLVGEREGLFEFVRVERG